MEEFMADGIPSVAEYRTVAGSDLFKRMEKHSNTFLEENESNFKNYTKKWVRDPLHQWSRQWEYPYVYQRIEAGIAHAHNPQILDAGSGMTFFPHYLNAAFERATIHCCDCDLSLEPVFKNLKQMHERPVEFVPADLKQIPYDSEMFNAVYCISVLEHTDEYEKIIEEFYRILAPGGVLVVTFDISLDGTRDIDFDRANALLSSLSSIIERDHSKACDLRAQARSDIFTTGEAYSMDEMLLPWSPPGLLGKIKSLFLNRKIIWPPPMTVCCTSLNKHTS